MKKIMFTLIAHGVGVGGGGYFPDELVDNLINAINALEEYDGRDKICLKAEKPREE